MQRPLLFLSLSFSLLISLGFVAGQPGPKDRPAQKAGLTPAESLTRFTVPKDLVIEQVLSEPAIAQPVFINFDERGRMWVVEYRQYPFPAGLKVVSKDRYWRTVYDRIPPPPPHHFRGKDRITIHEDTKGNGVYDKHTTFVDGLNIVTAVVRGRGGVWVLNPPYLLFYADKNHDDIPDGDPVVHLEGFGLEDTHSVVNSLRWGPDGWLYGAQGSTVGGNIKRPGDKQAVASMGQHIWRYHPETRRYEIFAEGGGNAFGVEIDDKGRVFSGHNGGNTRGFHYVQGGYYQKGFDKHGQLSNPYAFGYFPFMTHAPAQRFSHTFVIEEGGSALPEPYRHKLFAVMPLQGEVVMSEIKPAGSSFQTKDLAKIVTSTDNWFRPVDIKQGPNGALYVADFYDGHIGHLRHFDGKIEADNGRVYRIKAKGAKTGHATHYDKAATYELALALESDNRWVRNTALRLLGDRKGGKSDNVPTLRLLQRMLDGDADFVEPVITKGQRSLEALWALNLLGAFDDALALKTLNHADPYVRLWTVRLLGDNRRVSKEIADKLSRLAASEKNVEVRSQLACSARRLPAADGLPIVLQLLAHSEDVSDIHIPLLLWWSIEANAESDRAAVVKLFEDKAIWHLPLVEKHILERAMRRYAAAGRQKDLLTCAQLLRLAPGKEQAQALLAGFEKAYVGRPIANLPRELAEALAAHGGGSLALRLRLGDAKALDEALATLGNEKAKDADRLQLIQVFGEVSHPRSVPVLLKLLDRRAEPRKGPAADALQQAALTALQLYADPAIGAEVVKRYPDFPPSLRPKAQSLLAIRSLWTKDLLQAVDAGKIDKNSIPPEAVRKFLLHRDDRIQKLVRKHWGEVKGATTAEMRLEVDRLVKVVRTGSGEPYEGKKLFDTTCARCHQLFNKGGDFGPNLTTFKRDDVENMMLHIVNPSAEIREGYENYLVVTQDGRALNGFLVEKDDKIVVLRGAEGQTSIIRRGQIDEIKVLPVSLMPEGLLRGMSDQQVRNLFAYLRASQPLNVKD